MTGLYDLEDILLFDEGHLHVELIELARRPVRARVLVAEAWRDLKVPIETRNHIQLFELLGCLWKRVKLSGMQPAWDQKIASALWRSWP